MSRTMIGTILVTGSDVTDALRAVIPHAKPAKDGLPVLSTVHIQRHGDWIYFTATNRYTLGRYRIPVDPERTDPTQGLDILVPLDSAKALLKLATGRGVLVTLTQEGAKEGGTLTVSDLTSTSIYRAQEGAFPALDSLLSAAVSAAGDHHTSGADGWNPDLLALFAKAADPHDTLVMWPRHSGKPGLVTIGDRFVGLIMPIRLDESTTVPEWVTGTSASKAVAA